MPRPRPPSDDGGLPRAPGRDVLSDIQELHSSGRLDLWIEFSEAVIKIARRKKAESSGWKVYTQKGDFL